jgi:hypothetical protein
MKPLYLRRYLALAMLFVTASAFATPSLIGNKNVASEKLDAAAVKAVFLGKKVSWDGAGRIVLAVLKGGPVAEEFLKGSVEMSVSAFNNHWRRLAMTGGGTAPKSFDKEEDLRKFVAETPGAIGFIDSANVDASVVALTPGS